MTGRSLLQTLENGFEADLPRNMPRNVRALVSVPDGSERRGVAWTIGADKHQGVLATAFGSSKADVAVLN
jgi:hypothetical protein